ncbi:MAG: ROK family protein [Rudaea sp.]
MQRNVFVGIELGGTKILCRAIDGSGTLLLDRRFATSTPAAAVDDLATCFASIGDPRTRVAAIGIASFGPVVVDAASADFGCILATPKPGWSNFNLRAALADRFGVPIAVDTDVNAAAIAEHALGAGRGLDCVAYVTVGTGIGGGLVTRHGPLHGALHPEIGHLLLRRYMGDEHESTCPFHADCAEGLAAGPALGRRLGPTRALADAPEVQALVAHYLGVLASGLVMAWSPQRIVMGGGVMAAPGLLEQTAAAMRSALGNYGACVSMEPGFIAAAQLADAGLEGALILARAAQVTLPAHTTSSRM